MPRLSALICFALFAALLLGCGGDEDVRGYTVPAEELDTDSPDFGAAPMAPQDEVHGMESGNVHWDPPDEWTAVDAGSFALAKYELPETVDGTVVVSVSRLAGDGGGMAANVNRWRRQLGLSPLGGDELAAITETMESELGAWALVPLLPEAKGEEAAQGIFAGILERPDMVWFVKANGPVPALETQRDAITAFIRGIHD